MKVILIWYFLSYGANGAIHWSPPLPSLQECQRVQQVFTDQVSYKKGFCIQISEAVK